jgi:soluble cytochrome b562
LIGKQKQRNDALGKLLESQKGFITIAEKIKQTPKSHVTELLNFTFEEGFRYAVMSLDKIEYEAYEKICRDIDLEWEALKVFSEQVLEHIKQAGEKQL